MTELAPASPHWMRMREVSDRMGIKPAAIDRAIRAGKFPRPFLIGIRAKAWRSDEIDAHLAKIDRARADYIDPAVPSPRIAA